MVANLFEIPGFVFLCSSCTCTFLFVQLLCTTVSVSSPLSSLSTPLLSSFQASTQKLTWREISFEALQPPGTKENEREGERQQEMQVDEEGVGKRLVTECFHATIK